MFVVVVLMDVWSNGKERRKRRRWRWRAKARCKKAVKFGSW
jgi:hypothetical protein